MKALKECRYSVFISYASDDDRGNNRWVDSFSDELMHYLRARERGAPGAFLSGRNGPVSGVLDEKLREAIADSFAMVVIVHENYLISDWCLAELRHFRDCFGEEGLRNRLLIVALSRRAVEALVKSPRWNEVAPLKQLVWMPFYRSDDEDRPCQVYLDERPNVTHGQFNDRLHRFSESLLLEMRKPPAAAPRHDDTRPVVIGLTPPSLAPRVDDFERQLRAAGVAVRRISTEQSLFNGVPEFNAAARLILPFDRGPPLMHDLMAGGHLAVLKMAWLRRTRDSRSIDWLDLGERGDGQQADSEDADWIAANATPAMPASVLLAQYTDRRASSARGCVRIYIESNQNERSLWQTLGDRVARVWERMAAQIDPDHVPPLVLRPRGLPIDHLDQYPSIDDADGVILLWGKKSPDALVAQINKVEERLPGRHVAPGIVAYLTPPQPNVAHKPAWGWNVLRFINDAVDSINVAEDETTELEQFLSRIIERRRLNQPLGAAP